MIDIICPSRGRPENLERLWNACPHDGRVRVHTYVDDDDPKRDEYLELKDVIPGMMYCGPRIRLVPAANTLVQALIPAFERDSNIVAFMGDDHLPHGDWVPQVEAAMRPMGVVYGNDLIQGEALATAAFLDAEIVCRLGYLFPPGLLHMYGDNFWMTIGRYTDRLAYVPDLIVEHVHPLRTGAWDETTTEANGGAIWANDTPVWEAYLEEVWPEERKKLDD